MLRGASVVDMAAHTGIVYMHLTTCSEVRMARMTLEMTEAVRERLDVLKQHTSAASVTEVIRRAVETYALMVEYAAMGYEVALVSPNGGRTVLVVPEIRSVVVTGQA